MSKAGSQQSGLGSEKIETQKMAKCPAATMHFDYAAAVHDQCKNALRNAVSGMSAGGFFLVIASLELPKHSPLPKSGSPQSLGWFPENVRSWILGALPILSMAAFGFSTTCVYSKSPGLPRAGAYVVAIFAIILFVFSVSTLALAIAHGRTEMIARTMLLCIQSIGHAVNAMFISRYCVHSEQSY